MQPLRRGNRVSRKYPILLKERPIYDQKRPSRVKNLGSLDAYGTPARHLSESSGSHILPESGRKFERKILRLIFRLIIGIVYSEQTQEEQA